MADRKNASVRLDGSGRVDDVLRTGGMDFAHEMVSATPFTVDATHHILCVDSSGGDITLNLPTAVGVGGRIYCILKVSSDINIVTVDGDGSETIGGDLTQAFSSQYSGICFHSDGANWNILPGGQARVMKRLESAVYPALGAAAPTQVIDSNVNGFKFAVNDSILEVFVIPSDWSPGTGIDIHGHWYSTNTTASRYVQFRCSYRLLANGEQVTGGTSGNLDTGDILLPTTTKQTFEADHGTIPAGNISVGDHLYIEMSRIAASGTAPAGADNPIFTHFDIEYVSDRRGS